MKSIAKLKDRARKHEQKEDWESAIHVYQEVLETEEGEDELDLELGLYNRIGDLYLRMGRTDDAVAYYEQAAEKYADAGFVNNAIALCNKALRHRPERPQLYRRLSGLCLEQGFASDARRWILEFAEREVRAGRVDAALEGLSEFVASAGDPDVREFLAQQLATHDQQDEAVRQYARAYAERVERGQNDAALKVAEKARELDPTVDLAAAGGTGADDFDRDPVSLEAGDTEADAALDDGGDIHSPGLETAGLDFESGPAEDPDEEGGEDDGLEVTGLEGLETSLSEPDADADEPIPEDTGLGGLETFGAVDLEEAGAGTDAVPDPEDDLGLEEGDEPDPLPLVEGTEQYEGASAAAELEDLETGPGADPADDHFGDGLGIDLGDDLDTDVGDDLVDGLGDDLEIGGGDVEADSDETLGTDDGELEADLGDDLETGLDGDLGDDFEADLGDDLESSAGELEANLGDDLETDLGDDLETGPDGDLETDPGDAPEAVEGLETSELDVSGLEVAEPMDGLEVEEPGSVGSDTDTGLDLDELPDPEAEAGAEAGAGMALDLDALPEDESGTDAGMDLGLDELDADAASQISDGVADEDAGAGEPGVPEELGGPGLDVGTLDTSGLDELQRGVEEAEATGDDAARVTAYVALARALAEQGAETRSRAIYQRVLELEPGHEEAASAVGGGVEGQETALDLDAVLREMDPGEAAALRNGPPEGDPEDPEFAAMLTQFRAKVTERAEPEDAGDHYDLGLAFKEMGLIDEAIAEFQTALTGGEERLKVYEELGQCFMQKEQYTVAVKVLNRALQVPHQEDSELLGVQYHLGRCHEYLGDRDAARESYQRVLELDPSFGDVSDRLERL